MTDKKTVLLFSFSYPADKKENAEKMIYEFLDGLEKKLEVEIGQVNEDVLCLVKCQNLIKELGPTAIMQMIPVQEELLPPGSNKPQLVTKIQSMLDKLKPFQELVIIDGYIFPQGNRRDPNYADTVVDVLKNVVNGLSKLIFITSRDYDVRLSQDIQNRLKQQNQNLVVEVKNTDVFHDRFWITDRNKGMLVGTSLNGIGKKYFVIDYLEEQDVRDIVQAAIDEGLI